jgi:hypothetical protein
MKKTVAAIVISTCLVSSAIAGELKPPAVDVSIVRSGREGDAALHIYKVCELDQKGSGCIGKWTTILKPQLIDGCLVFTPVNTNSEFYLCSARTEVTTE